MAGWGPAKDEDRIGSLYYNEQEKHNTSTFTETQIRKEPPNDGYTGQQDNIGFENEKGETLTSSFKL